jgi:unsaturated rhamnogalacturonyl hydrolase
MALRTFTLAIVCGFTLTPCFGQESSLPERIAEALIAVHSNEHAATMALGHWDEEEGAELAGIHALWYNTAKGDYFRYLKSQVDKYVSADGSIDHDRVTSDSLSYSMLGTEVLQMYRVTLDGRYYKAAVTLRDHLLPICIAAFVSSEMSQPKELCQAEPFLAEFASVFGEPRDFAQITGDFVRWEREVGMLSRQAASTSTKTREIGEAWLAVALVDSIPFYPHSDPARGTLLAILNRTAVDGAPFLDRYAAIPNRKTKGIEAHRQPLQQAAAYLFIYALLKSVRSGYLPASYSADTMRSWQAIVRPFPRRGDKGGVADSASNEPTDRELTNLGACLLAANEAGLAPTHTLGRGATVLLDAWFNSQQRKNAAGQMESFHYKWSDFSDSGYSLFGHMLQSYGAATKTLYSAPTRENLSNARFYIIASPDIPVKNPHPHYMTEHDAEEIAAWVKHGGVLVMMENDPPNADLAHLNNLADKFGIHFDDVLVHHIIGERVEDGRITVSADGRLFHDHHTLYMKDTCAISVHGSALALLEDRGDIVMAAAKFGRGTVFAAVDPWLYNEYTDGRKNPLIYDQFDNYAGGKELVRWLLEQRPQASSTAGKRRR